MWGKGKFLFVRVFMTLEPDRLTLRRLYSIGKELRVLWIIGKEKSRWAGDERVLEYVAIWEWGMEVAKRQSKMYFKPPIPGISLVDTYYVHVLGLDVKEMLINKWRRKRVEVLNEWRNEWMSKWIKKQIHVWINKPVTRTGPPLIAEIKFVQI